MKDSVENMSKKTKNKDTDLLSQLSTAPNSPAAYEPESNEEKEDQELSKEQVGP